MGPLWDVYQAICIEGGYDLRPAAGQTVSLWSFPVRMEWYVGLSDDDRDGFGRVMKAVAIVDQSGVVRCLAIRQPDDIPFDQRLIPDIWAAPRRYTAPTTGMG